MDRVLGHWHGLLQASTYLSCIGSTEVIHPFHLRLILIDYGVLNDISRIVLMFMKLLSVIGNYPYLLVLHSVDSFITLGS